MSTFQVKLYETRLYIVEVEAEDEDIAVEEALEELDEDEHFDQSVAYFWEVKKLQDTGKDRYYE